MGRPPSRQEVPSGSRGVKTPKAFLGTWRIVETELWDEDALDLVVPAHITFTSEGLGHFQMIAVQGGIDARFDGKRVEFSWVGDDDGSETNGRGWAEIVKDGKLRGRIYFHQGDDSGFVATRKA
jgi:hypothetical protein